MFIEWKKDLEIGVEEIDVEHRTIIETFQKLYEKMRIGEGHELYDEIISFLDGYVDNHLVNEENYQEKIGYDDRASHKAKHDEFRHILKELKEDKLESVSNQELIKINQVMKDWLLHHILEVDMKIGEFVRKREA